MPSAEARAVADSDRVPHVTGGCRLQRRLVVSLRAVAAALRDTDIIFPTDRSGAGVPAQQQGARVRYYTSHGGCISTGVMISRA